MALVLAGAAIAGGVGYYLFTGNSVPEAPKLEIVQGVEQKQVIQCRVLSAKIPDNEQDFQSLKNKLVAVSLIPTAPEMLDSKASRYDLPKIKCIRVPGTDENLYMSVKSKLQRIDSIQNSSTLFTRPPFMEVRQNLKPIPATKPPIPKENAFLRDLKMGRSRIFSQDNL